MDVYQRYVCKLWFLGLKWLTPTQGEEMSLYRQNKALNLMAKQREGGSRGARGSWLPREAKTAGQASPRSLAKGSTF